MSMLSLAISCLTTSSLPWLMNLTFQVPKQYCSLFHWTLPSRPDNIHNWASFPLWLILFILEISNCPPLFPSSILDTSWPGVLISQCCIFLPFQTVHGVLKTRILKWFAIPFSSGPHFVRPWLARTCPSAAPRSWMTCLAFWLSHCWSLLSV